MKASLPLFCAGILLLAHPGMAQTTAAPETAVPPASAAAPASATAAVNGKYELHDGDDIPLKFAQDLSSKTATEGDPVNFVLDGDVKVGDVVVIKSGTKAVGEVTNAKRAGMMGKGGELSVRIDYIRVGETKVRLRGSKGKEGASGTTSAVVLTVLFGPIGLIKHGHEIDIKQGSPLKVYLDDNVYLPPA
jgi:hypothetical protein